MSDVQGITGDLNATEALVAKEAMIADLQSQLTALAAQVASLTAAVAAKEAKIAELTSMAVAAGTLPNQAPVPEGTPLEIKLTSPYGYIDANGQNRSWLAGTVIKDRHEIALLAARKADHVVTQAAPPPEPAA